jgi:hypothetical protein
MRNPGRIGPILELLRTVWELNPDLRLGQIFVNVVHPPQQSLAIFYIEDDEIVRRLEAHFGVYVRPITGN